MFTSNLVFPKYVYYKWKDFYYTFTSSIFQAFHWGEQNKEVIYLILTLKLILNGWIFIILSHRTFFTETKQGPTKLC